DSDGCGPDPEGYRHDALDEACAKINHAFSQCPLNFRKDCLQNCNKEMKNWNDLRLVLAIARGGRLRRAARDLGVDHSTAFRRLQAIESHLGTPLFERLPDGLYEPTPTGARMAAAAERMEDEALALDRDIAGHDHRLTGRLRITSSETLA